MDWTLPVLPPIQHDLLSPTDLIIQSLDHQFYAVTSRGKSNHTNQLDIFKVTDGKGLNRCLIPLDEDITTATFADNDKSVVVGTSKGMIYFAQLNPKGMNATIFASLKMSEDTIAKLVYLKNQRVVASLSAKGQLRITEFPHTTPATPGSLKDQRFKTRFNFPGRKKSSGRLIGLKSGYLRRFGFP